MLIHIAPQCLSLWGIDVGLISIEISELELTLREGKELRARRPYPNKFYLVASAKADRAAKDGFFVETSEPISEFHVLARWDVNGDEILYTNRFTILDTDFDATSADPHIWQGISPKWASRWPEQIPYDAPIYLKPVLEIGPQANIVPRNGCFLLPSLERERVVALVGHRYRGNRAPNPEHAFKAQGRGAA